MPTGSPLYPGAPAKTNGNQITVERFMKNPTLIEKAIMNLSNERFIADFIYDKAPAEGGSVLYTEITEADLYTEGEPKPIAPGTEFPLVGDEEGDLKTAAVTKRGSAITVSYETQRRDRRDVLRRGLTKLSNSSIKKHDAIGVGHLFNNASVPRSNATDAWDEPGADIPVDLFGAVYAVEQIDLGYVADTILINPAEALKLLGRKDIRDMLPKENAALNPILSAKLSGLCNIPNWIVSNRVPVAKAAVLQRKVAGSIAEELGFYTRVVDQPEYERYIVQAARVDVPAITDPLAVHILEGL